MKKLSRVIPCLLTVLLLASPTYAADISDQDLAALKAQIAKLSHKVDQLEAQQKKSKATSAVAATVPAAKAAPTPAAIPATFAVTSPAPAAPIVYPATSSFVLTKEDPAPATVISTDDLVTKGTFPGSFHVPGTNTSVRLGGYVKLDANTDMGTGYGAPFVNDAAIPLSNDPRSQQGEQTTLGAQQSRLTLDSRTPSSWGEIRTYFEGDFFGAAAANGNTNAYGFGIRHAYGSVGTESTGQLLAGQTWSNYLDEAVVPEIMDYLGPAGRLFVRQPQIRYTQGFGPLTLSGSVETGAVNTGQTSNANAITSANTASTTVTPRDAMPDIVARGDFHYTDDGYVSLRALVNQINVDRTVSVTNNDTADKYGYGVSLSGKQGVFEKDYVIYNGYLGNGTGRYVYNIGAAGVYYNTATNTLKTLPYYGGTLGYQHVWSSEFRSSIFGGAVRIVNDTSIMTAPVLAQANKYIMSGAANIVWQPVPSYLIGLEYSHGYRKVETDIEGNLDRLEASFIYNF